MSNNQHTSRRSVLKSLGAAGVAVGLAGCVGSGGDPLTVQVDALRELVSKYDQNIDLAREDGYVQLAGPGVQGMGWHLSNPQLVGSAVENGFSLDEPTTLCYDSEQNLGAIEFSAPARAVSQSPNLFDDSESDERERWTRHVTGTHVLSVPEYDSQTPVDEITFEQMYNQANWFEYPDVRPDIEVGGRVTEQFPGHDAPETRVVDMVETHPTLASLHVWAFAENPDGLFAEVNPEFGQDLAVGKHVHE